MTVEAGQGESVERIVVGVPNNDTDICSRIRQKMVVCSSDEEWEAQTRRNGGGGGRWEMGILPQAGSGKEDVCTWFGALGCHPACQL